MASRGSSIQKGLKEVAQLITGRAVGGSRKRKSASGSKTRSSRAKSAVRTVRSKVAGSKGGRAKARSKSTGRSRISMSRKKAA